MTVWQAIKTRWRALFHKRELDAELDEELRFHVEMQTRKNIESGLNPEKARLAALRRFGWTERIKESCRDVRGVKWIEDATADLRFGARMLLRTPGFTALIVLTLAIGIGANTALFSVVDRLILSPIPARDSHRLIHIEEVDVTHNRSEGVSPPVFMELQGLTNAFESICALDGHFMVVSGKEFSETIYGTEATPGMFELLGARPLLGRTFRPDDAVPGKDQVLVISHGFWQSHFGADPGIVNKTIVLDGKSWTIVGVMPPSFQFPRGEKYCQYWRPHVFQADDYNEPQQRMFRNSVVVGRLRPDCSLGQAAALVNVITRRLQKEFPDANAQYVIRARPARFMFVTEELQRTLWSLSGAVFFVLVIACANVASLLLARAETRRREVAVRIAIGASRQRIIRQLLTESALLSVLGGLLGLLLAWWGVRLLAGLTPSSLPRMTELGTDWRLFGLATLISLASGIGCGLAPAWQASHTRLDESLREAAASHSGSRRRRLFQQTMVVAEIAATLVLLVGAGLMVHTVTALLRVNPGFDPKGLVWVMFRYPSDVAQVAVQQNLWNKRMAERLRSLPGVESVAFLGMGGGWYYKVEGRREVVDVRGNRIDVGTNNAFRTLRTPLVAGRFFEEADASPKAKTILVNEELARLAWPGESPLGKRIAHAETEDWLEAVGVVGNIKDWTLDKPPVAIFYEPYERNLMNNQSPVFMLRAKGDLALLTKPLQDLAKEMATGANAPSIHFPEKELYASTELRRIYMWFLTVFGMVGLTLATLGIFGVLSYWVTQRTREIGIRMALGANARDVLGMVLARGARLMIIGISLGMGAAFALSRLLRSQLFGTSPTQPLALVCALMVLCLVALVGCYLPARRATRTSPATSLRQE